MHFRAVFLFVALISGIALCHAAVPVFSPFLVNMPMNSDKRCVGIAGTAEALIQGERSEGQNFTVENLAHDIYESFTSGKKIAYPATIVVDGKSLPIENPVVLEELSTRVANLYKNQFNQLRRSREGTKKLLAAEDQTVKTRDELVKLLQAESEKIGFFCCSGTRVFPDGRTSHTSHAVLLQLMPHDIIAVYDPNEPGGAAECSVDEEGLDLEVSWRCKYRDQGVITTQYYEIVPQDRFFSALK